MYSRTPLPPQPSHLQVAIDRLRFVLGVVAIIAIVVTFVIGQSENSGQNARIKKIESPCLRFGSKSKECHQAFGAAIKSITPYQLCTLLSRQPELTGVTPADCVRIAREARQKADQSTPRSRDGSSPVPSAGSQPEGNSAPTAPGGSGSPGSGHPVRNPGESQTPGNPAQPGSPSSPVQEPQSQPTSPGNPSAGSEAPPPASAPETPASKPPLVELEVPVLPVHVCVPGVTSVNC